MSRLTTALICEGACNPNIDAIDAIVRQSEYRHPQGKVDGVCPRVNEREAAIQRSLVYTPHTVAGDVATCTICRKERRYGNSIEKTLRSVGAEA